MANFTGNISYYGEIDSLFEGVKKVFLFPGTPEEALYNVDSENDTLSTLTFILSEDESYGYNRRILREFWENLPEGQKTEKVNQYHKKILEILEKYWD